MNYCKYSIIPTPKDELRCSSCGKKLEGLPHYPQVIQLFLNIKRSAFESQYLGLGLGVPMCENCDRNIISQIEEKHDNTRIVVVFFVSLFLFAVIGEISGQDIRYLSLPIMGGILFYIYYQDKSKYKESNELLTDNGIELIDDAIRSLKEHKWCQDMDRSLYMDYSPKALKIALDRICEGGQYSLLNIATGFIEDFHDPETLEKIFEESIIIVEKDYDGDFDGD